MSAHPTSDKQRVATLPIRRASAEDAVVVARLLHEFNGEFDVASPGVPALTSRLESLLAERSTICYLSRCALGVALVTRRSNVWSEGPVDLLDELYVVPQYRGLGIGGALITRLVADARDAGVSVIEINVDEADVDAQRFYERHGFTGRHGPSSERAFYFSQEL